MDRIMGNHPRTRFPRLFVQGAGFKPGLSHSLQMEKEKNRVLLIIIFFSLREKGIRYI